MALSTAETIGFCTSLTQFLRANETDLKAKGLDVSGRITELEALTKTLVAEDEKQEGLKREQVAQTRKVTDSQNALYDAASSLTDAAAGALGKRSAGGQQALALRADVSRKRGGGRGKNGGNGEATPGGTPPPFGS